MGTVDYTFEDRRYEREVQRFRCANPSADEDDFLQFNGNWQFTLLSAEEQLIRLAAELEASEQRLIKFEAEMED